MTKYVGGRGKKAPYKSTHVRIPEPLKDKVEQLKQEFLNNEAEQSVDNASLPDIEAATEYARSVIKMRKNAKYSVVKLLNLIYNSNLTEKDITN